MKMTEENWGRLMVTVFLFAGSLATALDHKTPAHIAFSVMALILLAKTVYNYVKGF